MGYEAVCDACGEHVATCTSPEAAAFEVERHKWPHDQQGCQAARDARDAALRGNPR